MIEPKEDNELDEQLTRAATVASALLRSTDEHIRLGAVNALTSCLGTIGYERQRQYERERREGEHTKAGTLYLRPVELLELAKSRGLTVTLDAELQIKVEGPSMAMPLSVDLIQAINWNRELILKLLAPKSNPKETP